MRRFRRWLQVRSERRGARRRIGAEERLLGSSEHAAFGSVLVVDTPADHGGWVTILCEDGERWTTRDGEVFYSHGRAVRVTGGRGGVGVSAHGALVRRRAQQPARSR